MNYMNFLVRKLFLFLLFFIFYLISNCEIITFLENKATVLSFKEYTCINVCMYKWIYLYIPVLMYIPVHKRVSTKHVLCISRYEQGETLLLEGKKLSH